VEKIKSLAGVKNVVKRYKDAGKTIVFATGVYDILHIGHVKFLKKAKEVGDILVVALDGDRVVQHMKGGGRPINSEKSRAEVLGSLEVVDHIYIFNVDRRPEFNDWFKVCEIVRPDILAVTEGDSLLEQKRLVLKDIGCQVIIVTSRVESASTTRIAKLLEIE